MPLVSYEPAELKEWETGWQIEYKVWNPEKLRMEKQRQRWDKIRKKFGDIQARKQAKIICKYLNSKLEKGFNPFIKEGRIENKKLVDVLDIYIQHKYKDLKNGIFREDSMRVYKSQVNMLKDWMKMKKQSEISVTEFSHNMAIKYLDWVYIDSKRDISSRTWNNYVKFLRTIWNWMIEKNYCSENPFKNIKVKPKTEKERDYIPKELDQTIIEYCRKNNPPLELVICLVYNSFMRPKEICRTQIKDIHLFKNGIYLSGTKTKNHRPRWCLLPPHVIEMIAKLGIERLPPNYYLVSERLLPGVREIDTRRVDKHWDKMRNKISLPKQYKLYSYRDTGITDLKMAGNTNLFISSITGHLNADEIETYTHEPDKRALDYVMTKSKQPGQKTVSK
jgi:integrase